MTLFIVARFPLGIVRQDHPSHMLWTAVLWSTLLYFVRLHVWCAPYSYKVLHPCNLAHSPAKDITAVGETLVYFVINRPSWITSAQRL